MKKKPTLLQLVCRYKAMRAAAAQSRAAARDLERNARELLASMPSAYKGA